MTTDPTAFSRRWVVGAANVELAVHEGGLADAPVVVLVHGYPDTSRVWDGVAARLAHRYHVVTYDVRGAGASGAPDSREGYALDLLMGDMAKVLATVSPTRPVHLVGHDWGSVQGWEAVTGEGAGRRFASFTSISGPCLDHVGHWMLARRSLRPKDVAVLVRQGLRSWYVGAFQLPGATFFWRLGGARLVVRSLRRAGELPEGVEPNPTLATDGARGINLYRANVPQRLRHPGDRSTEVPVQLIVPSGDPFVTPALLDGTARWAPRLWRRDVPGGHWLPRTEPDRVAGWIEDLVEHVEAGGPAPSSLERHRVLPTDRPGVAVDRGRVVVVTGAGSGVGRRTALAFAERGAEVVAVDGDGEAAARTARLCTDRGAVATHHQVDVGDADAMQRLAKLVEHDHGGADVVVNHAGVGVTGGLLDTTTDDWERVLRADLWGVIHGSRLFARQMVARGEGGHIVNVASAAAFGPSRLLPAYATSKAAVLMLTECLRAELADRDIGVTAVCPGVADTGPDRVADAIVKAVHRGGGKVVPVTPEAHLARAVGRFAPGLARRRARVDPAGRP